jgi:hypothetical protein
MTLHEAFEDTLRHFAVDRLDNDEVITDAVLIIGVQHFDDDGDRCGRVFALPYHGSQPYYITLGLIAAAQQMIGNRLQLCDDDE